MVAVESQTDRYYTPDDPPYDPVSKCCGETWVDTSEQFDLQGNMAYGICAMCKDWAKFEVPEDAS